ncbi:MAG: hypothetical protein HFI42_02470 [Lachnospiraceae bacterium]|jgi:flagellar protein FlgJ|nr:hypothetical protein [Lachnospiraceae bacterium]MCI9149351.1 hypothetical protein [Lachnospiraceae bacterium]
MSVTLDNLNLYNNTAANAAANKTNKLEQTLNGDFSKASDQELMDVCKEFEAYFLEQVFKAMQKMVPESDHQSSYTKQMQSYFKDEMVQKLAKDSTETNGLGLAQTLYEQMKRNYNL